VRAAKIANIGSASPAAHNATPSQKLFWLPKWSVARPAAKATNENATSGTIRARKRVHIDSAHVFAGEIANGEGNHRSQL
jgi:hypothetical protein